MNRSAIKKTPVKVDENGGIPFTKMNPVEKANANPRSLRAAINGKCADCCGMENYVKNIRYCPATDCTLWPVRPYQS